MTVALPCATCGGPVAHGRHLMPGATCTDTNVKVFTDAEIEQNIEDAFEAMRKRRKR